MVAAFFEGDDDDDDAVLGELLAVADDDVSYVAYAEAVDEDGAGLDALDRVKWPWWVNETGDRQVERELAAYKGEEVIR